MKIKTNELTGAALDWAVAEAAGLETYFDDGVVCLKGQPFDDTGSYWLPTQNWSQGGPIIEREKISVLLSFKDSYAVGANARPSGWCARMYQYGVLIEPLSYGPTPLVAAMRCYVASKLGDTVDIPEALSAVKDQPHESWQAPWRMEALK